jgi:hypothetical protein
MLFEDLKQKIVTVIRDMYPTMQATMYSTGLTMQHTDAIAKSTAMTNKLKLNVFYQYITGPIPLGWTAELPTGVVFFREGVEKVLSWNFETGIDAYIQARIKQAIEERETSSTGCDASLLEVENEQLKKEIQHLQSRIIILCSN